MTRLTLILMLSLAASAVAQPMANPIGPLEAVIDAPSAPGAALEAGGEPVEPPSADTDPAPVAQPREKAATESLPLGASATPPEPDIVRAPAEEEKTSLADHPAVRTVGALTLVLSIIFGLRSLLQGAARRGGGLASGLGPGGRAPSGVLSVLGRYPVGKGQTLVLLQLDRRVLLLSQGSTGFQTLAELTDADEVASVVRKTADDEGASLSKRFSSMLRALERDPKIAGDGAAAPLSPRRAMALSDYESQVLESPVSQMPEMESYDAIRRRLDRRLSRLRGGDA